MSESAQEVAPTIPADSLAAAVMRAEAATLALRDIPRLREAAQSLVDALSRIGCYQLVSASQAAEPLATAAALLSDGSIHLNDLVHCSADKVVIIDAATITGNATRACAAYLRERGATWVGAVIYDRVRPDLDDLDGDSNLDLVAALA